MLSTKRFLAKHELITFLRNKSSKNYLHLLHMSIEKRVFTIFQTVYVESTNNYLDEIHLIFFYLISLKYLK